MGILNLILVPIAFIIEWFVFALIGTFLGMPAPGVWATVAVFVAGLIMAARDRAATERSYGKWKQEFEQRRQY
jgi:hypothetical protein